MTVLPMAALNTEDHPMADRPTAVLPGTTARAATEDHQTAGQPGTTVRAATEDHSHSVGHRAGIHRKAHQTVEVPDNSSAKHLSRRLRVGAGRVSFWERPGLQARPMVVGVLPGRVLLHSGDAHQNLGPLVAALQAAARLTQLNVQDTKIKPSHMTGLYFFR